MFLPSAMSDTNLCEHSANILVCDSVYMYFYCRVILAQTLQLTDYKIWNLLLVQN